MAKFVQKGRQELHRMRRTPINGKIQQRETITEAVTNVKKNQNDMTTKEKVELANQVLGEASKVKRIRKEQGLIERAESTKTILTEDNRELLND